MADSLCALRKPLFCSPSIHTRLQPTRNKQLEGSWLCPELQFRNFNIFKPLYKSIRRFVLTIVLEMLCGNLTCDASTSLSTLEKPQT